MAIDALYLENLEEYINDENRIVTYRWFSTNLKVHVNEAKQMLYEFVQDQRNKKDNDNLSVTYFVAGLTKLVDGQQQTHKCAVVREEELEAYRHCLAVITSSHIYSVQRAKLKDSGPLYTADYDILKQPSKYSSIKFSKAKLRSGAEIDSLRKASIPQTTEPTAVKTNGTTVSNGACSKPNKGPQKATGIAAMFAKVTKKAEEKKEDQKQEKETKCEKNTTGKKGGMMAFFSKQTDKNPAEETAKSDVQPVLKQEVKKSPSPPPKKKAQAKMTKKTPRKRESDDDGVSQKKRRRIRQDLFDSSSDEEAVEIEDDSPVPSPTPAPAPVLASDSDKEMEVTELIPEKGSPEKSSAGKQESGDMRRKRRRKQVPKTFMDDDGYMVTEKVWESESTDASDAEPVLVRDKVPQKTSPQKSPQKKSPPSTANAKQMSMMSFFKKK